MATKMVKPDNSRLEWISCGAGEKVGITDKISSVLTEVVIRHQSPQKQEKCVA